MTGLSTRSSLLTFLHWSALSFGAFGAVNIDANVTEAPTPYFLGGPIKAEQVHTYSPTTATVNHTAEGDGLSRASTGKPSSFTIKTAEGDRISARKWNVQDGLFFYVWIAGENQIFIAEVINNGDGTLTATYESSFPGLYLIYVEEVDLSKHDEGRPILGSPFSLTISGIPTLEVDSLPSCGSEDGGIEESFWKPGTWISAIMASTSHGVGRDGWIFQPKTCTYDAYSYEDLMLLASSNEPTWLVILGSSVQRGLFLTLVDLVLARGQKDHFSTSVLQKCWGFADIKVGNLRITYQDMRLFTVRQGSNSLECNNEKLVSGSSSEYVRASRQFLNSTIFQEGKPWPSLILAPAHLELADTAVNLAIEVPLLALPPTWEGSLVLVDHMAVDGHWTQDNPTRTAFKNVGMQYHRQRGSNDLALQKMDSYRRKDPRIKFMSIFPIAQAKLFENEKSAKGARKYGGSVHYHYVLSDPGRLESYGGAVMVISTVLEMLAHVVIGIAAGPKASLREIPDKIPDTELQRLHVGDTFQICSDCPASLLPFHVKPTPQPICENVQALPGGARTGKVWDRELCPAWCLATQPVDRTPTESGMVDVRQCNIPELPP